jgi:hypothetical protein
MKSPNRIHEAVAIVASQIKTYCPEGKVRISYQPYESEDAHLTVFPPDVWSLDQCWDLGESMAGFCSDLFEREGVFIIVLVIDPPDKVRQADSEFLAAQARQRAS